MFNFSIPVIPECFADRVVIEILGDIPRFSTNKQHGKTKVENIVINKDDYSTRKNIAKYENSIALAIIALDKGVHPKSYFNNFNIEIYNSDNIIYKRHNSKEHYLILICPAIEKWMIEASKQAEVFMD
ncbi:MAG: hypothetical protein SGJ10_00005 [Bacteroidota bacterium]|nr:hypothetical protein [Bacteroidota bacterium]